MSGDETRSATAVVHVTYHLMPVAAPDTLPSIRSFSDDGLVYALPDALVVITGIHTGIVNVSVESRSTPPESVDLDDWNEVADYSVDVPTDTLQVGSLMSELPEGLPPLTAAGPGTYRVRVHARGRDTDVDGTASEPFEDYKLVCWPAARDEATVHKHTDRYGSTRRRR